MPCSKNVRIVAWAILKLLDDDELKGKYFFFGCSDLNPSHCIETFSAPVLVLNPTIKSRN
jgi:hypothetical protein